MILRVTAELNNLEVIRRFIEENVPALQSDPNTTYDLVQAVDECATNIIEHGYHEQPGPIEIEIERQDETITIALRDQAPLFDPTERTATRFDTAARSSANLAAWAFI